MFGRQHQHAIFNVEVHVRNRKISRFDDFPEPLSPPRIETVRVVTVEHADVAIDVINETLIASGGFIEAFSETAIMTWPDGDEAGQAHYNEMADEIRDRLFAETRPVLAEAFVRIAGDVTTRERRRR